MLLSGSGGLCDPLKRAGVRVCSPTGVGWGEAGRGICSSLDGVGLPVTGKGGRQGSGKGFRTGRERLQVQCGKKELWGG